MLVPFCIYLVKFKNIWLLEKQEVHFCLDGEAIYRSTCVCVPPPFLISYTYFKKQDKLQLFISKGWEN